MKALRRFFRLRIQRKGWMTSALANNVHVYPNHDTLQHEAHDCPCGVSTEAVPRDDGTFGYVITHYSLDAREAVEQWL